jgi:hypothetical protein
VSDGSSSLNKETCAIKPLILALCLGLGLPGAAFAEGIAWEVAGLAPGTVITSRNSEGIWSTLTARGRDGRGYRFDARAGRDGRGPVGVTLWYDAKGQVLRAAYADGNVAIYHPHDCSRTLGTCRFAEQRSNGETVVRVTVRRRTGGGVSVTERDAASGEVIAKGAATLDKTGLAVTSWYHPSGFRKITTEVVSVTPP